MADGITVKAWTFDELYGRDGKFLDGLDERKQAFVGEVPPDFRMWTRKPTVLRKAPRNTRRKGKGRNMKYPRLAARDAKAYQVRSLAKHSPGLARQTPQRYRVRDSHKGPEIWEVRWHVCYRRTQDGRLVSSQCTLIVAENVRTGEVKFFVSKFVAWPTWLFAAWDCHVGLPGKNTKPNWRGSHTTNAATPRQVVAIARNESRTISRWESIRIESKASSQSHRETKSKVLPRIEWQEVARAGFSEAWRWCPNGLFVLPFGYLGVAARNGRGISRDAGPPGISRSGCADWWLWLTADVACRQHFDAEAAHPSDTTAMPPKIHHPGSWPLNSRKNQKKKRQVMVVMEGTGG